MSSRIDQRIVEMSFENHKFEKGIKQSNNSLKNFADTLSKTGTGKDFKGLESSVESVSKSFSVMEQIGIGALRRIGDAAVTAGGSLIKSLSVDQLTAGLDKYQQKIESVQTMVSAGYGLDEVEKTMDQLMWFADETSYSFADMTDNMAKFVSAGVDLETSSKAMQGIATWAAHSGKNSQAASIAMFNLSQAIGMGYVDTLNWRSIMNQNMNTVMFKDIAIGVAEATGAIKKGQVTIQDFDTNLKDKWFTNDVLLKTLDQYGAYAEKVKDVQEEMNFDTAKQAMDYMDANADKYANVMDTIGNAAFKASQESKSFADSIDATMDAVSTGWMQTYEIIFGTLYEAKANFSALTEVLWTVFAAGAETRNQMLSLIKAGGGIKNLFQIIKNASVALLTPLRAVSAAFDQFFPPKTETQWLNLISTLESVTRGLIISEETASKIQRTFAGFFAVVDIGWQTIKLFGNILWEVVGAFLPLGDSLLDTTASLGDFLVGLNALIKQSGIFEYALLGVKVAATLLKTLLLGIVGTIASFVHALWTADDPLGYIGEKATKVFSGLLDILQVVTSWISGKFTGAMQSLSKMLNTKFDMEGEGTIGAILRLLRDFIEFIAGEASEGIKSFADLLNNLDFSKIATFVTGGVLLLFINQLTQLTKTTNSLISTTNSFVSKFSKKLFGTTTKIKDLAFVFGVLSASLFVMSKIPWNELARGLVGLSGALLIFVGAYAAIQAITVMGTKALGGAEVAKSTFGIVTLAAGIAIMASAVKTISGVSQSDVWSAVGVIGAMMGLLTAYQALSALISMIPGQSVVSVKFSGMTFGVMGLVGLITLLKVISPGDIRDGIGKISSLMLTLTGIQLLFSVAAKIGGGHKLSTNMLGISVGLLTLVGVMKIIGAINLEDIRSQVTNILLLSGVLVAIQTMFNLAGRLSGGAKFKSHILSAQMGILVMIGLIAILNTMKPEEIQNGIKSIAKMAMIIAGLEVFTALASRIGGGAKLQKILGSVTITLLSFIAMIGLLNVYEDQGVVDKGILSIMKMLGVIVAFETLSAAASRLSGGMGGLTSMLGLVGALLAVTASIALLAIGDQTALRDAAVSFSIAVIAIGVMAVGAGILAKHLSMLQTSFTSISGAVKVLIPGFIAVGTAVLAAAALLAIIEPVLPIVESNWDSMQRFGIAVIALSGLVAGFTALSTLPGLQNPASLLSIVPGLAAVAGAILVTSGLFVAVSLVPQVDVGAFTQFLIGIGLMSAVAAGFTLLAPALALLGPTIGPTLMGAMTAILGVGMIIVAFTGLAVAMEALFGNNPDLLINGIDKLVLVGEGIGRLIGAIVGGFSSEILIGYGKGLAGFSAAISEIDTSSFAGVGSLAKALLIITGTSILDGMARFVNFGKDPVKLFGEQLQGLIGAFKKVDPADATRTSNVLAALAPMADNLKAVANAAKSIPNSGGFLGAFLGDNKIDKFAKDLISFLNGLKGLDVATDITPVDSALAAMNPMLGHLEAVAKAASKIPNSGGFLGAFLGDNKIDKFAKDLVGFLNVFKGLDVNTDVIPVSNILSTMSEGLLPSLEKFATVANSLNASGGLAQLFSGNTTLTEFGREIVAFTIQLRNADFAVVKPAMAALADITESFSIVGKDVLENATKSFKNNKEPFQKEIVSILDAAVKTIDTKKKVMVVEISNIFKDAISDSKKYVKEFKKLGSDVVAGLASGINSESKVASKAIVNMSNAVIDSSKKTFATRSPSKVFEEIGGWLSKGLAFGINKDSKIATGAAVSMSKAVEGSVRDTLGVHSISEIFKSIGEWINKSLGAGIQNGKDALMKVAADLGLDTSNFTIKGMVGGMAEGEGAITSGISGLLDLLTGGPIAEVAEGAGEGIGDKVTSGMQSSLSDKKKGLGGSKTKKVVKTELEKIQAMIDDSKFYGQISLEEELALYEALKLVKGQSAEDHKKIDREVYRLIKEIYEGQLAYIDAVTEAETEAKEKREELYRDYMEDQASITEEAEKKLSELRTKHDKDQTSAKEAARKKELEAEKKYAESYNSILEKAEQERQKIREDYSAKQKSINDKLLSDIDAQNKAYESAVKSRADSIYNSYGLFSKVDEDPEVTGEELLENLRDQGAALSEWQQSLDALEARGVGKGLIEELQKMGPASKAQIKALLELTDEQMEEYVRLFEGKYVFARVKAETELEGLKDSTSEIIRDLKDQAAMDLQDLESTFADSMSKVNSQMADDLSELKTKHEETMSQINAELEEKLSEMQATFDEKTEEINTDTAEKLAKLEEEYNKSLTAINEDVDKKLKELEESFTSTMKTVRGKTAEEMKLLITDNKAKLTLLEKDTTALLKDVEKTHDDSGKKVVSEWSANMKELDVQTSKDLKTVNRTVARELRSSESEFEEAGYNATAGFSRGILNGMQLAVDAASEMAGRAADSARNALSIQSPSKVFASIGQFVSLGFANGMLDYADRAETAAKKMASGPIAVVSQALSDLESDLDIWEPVIAPVLDLSNFETSNLNGLLGADVDLAFRSARLAEEIGQNGSSDKDTITYIYNTFDLTGLTVRKESDVDAIATKLQQKQEAASRGRGNRMRPVTR